MSHEQYAAVSNLPKQKYVSGTPIRIWITCRTVGDVLWGPR